MQNCEFNIYDGEEKVRFSLGHPLRLGYEVGFEPFFVERYLQIHSP